VPYESVAIDVTNVKSEPPDRVYAEEGSDDYDRASNDLNAASIISNHDWSDELTH